MPESLIEQLPKIVAEGKKEVERILERLSGRISSPCRPMNMCFLQRTSQSYSGDN